jgi:hypothetical protein
LYSSDIRALEPVESLAAQKALESRRAKTIIAGTPKDKQDLEDAIEEENCRKALREKDPSLITVVEECRATWRRELIQREFAGGEYTMRGEIAPYAVAMNSAMHHVRQQAGHADDVALKEIHLGFVSMMQLVESTKKVRGELQEYRAVLQNHWEKLKQLNVWSKLLAQEYLLQLRQRHGVHHLSL